VPLIVVCLCCAFAECSARPWPLQRPQACHVPPQLALVPPRRTRLGFPHTWRRHLMHPRPRLTRPGRQLMCQRPQLTRPRRQLTRQRPQLTRPRRQLMRQRPQLMQLSRPRRQRCRKRRQRTRQYRQLTWRHRQLTRQLSHQPLQLGECRHQQQLRLATQRHRRASCPQPRRYQVTVTMPRAMAIVMHNRRTRVICRPSQPLFSFRPGALN